MNSKKRKGEDLPEFLVQKLKIPKNFEEKLIDSILNLTFLLEVDTNEETKYYAIKVKNESNTENKRNVELLESPQQLLVEDERNMTCVFNEEHNMYIYKKRKNVLKTWETICEKMGVYTIQTEEEWERYLQADMKKKESISELRIKWDREFNIPIKDYPPWLQVFNMSESLYWRSVNSLYFLPECTHTVVLNIRSLSYEILTKLIPKTVKYVTVIEKTLQDSVHFEFPEQRETFDVYNSMIYDTSNGKLSIYSEQEWNLLQSYLLNYSSIEHVYFDMPELNFPLKNSHKYMRSLDLGDVQTYNTTISLSSLFGDVLDLITLNENHENILFDHSQLDFFEVKIRFKSSGKPNTQAITFANPQMLKEYLDMRNNAQEHGIVELVSKSNVRHLWNETPIELWSNVHTLKIRGEACSSILYISTFPPNLISLFLLPFRDESVEQISFFLHKLPPTLQNLYLLKTHKELFPISFESRSINIFLGEYKFVLPADFQKLQNYIRDQKQIEDIKNTEKEDDVNSKMSTRFHSRYFAPLSNHIWDWSALDFDTFYKTIEERSDQMKDYLAFVPMYFYKLKEKELKLKEEQNKTKGNNVEEKQQQYLQLKEGNIKEQQEQYYMENEEQQQPTVRQQQQQPQTTIEDKENNKEKGEEEEDKDDEDDEDDEDNKEQKEYQEEAMEGMSHLSNLERIFRHVSSFILKEKLFFATYDFVSSVDIIPSNFNLPHTWWTVKLKNTAKYLIKLWFASKDFSIYYENFLRTESKNIIMSMIFITILYVCEKRHTTETLKKEFTFFQTIPHPLPQTIPIEYEKYLETLPLLSRALCVIQHWFLYWKSSIQYIFESDRILYWYQRLRLICYPNHPKARLHIESDEYGNPIISKQYDDTILTKRNTNSIPELQFIEEGLMNKEIKTVFESFHDMYEGEHLSKFERAKKRQKRFLSQMMRNTLWKFSTDTKREMMWGKYGDEDMVLLYNMARDPSRKQTKGKNPIGLYFAFLSYQILFLLLRISKPVFQHSLFVFRGITNIVDAQFVQRIAAFLKNGSEPNKQLVLQQLQSILHERQSKLFLATSADFETAHEFTDGSGIKSKILFKYHLPPSYPFLAMNDFFQFSFEEFELLLPGDSRWRADNFQLISSGSSDKTYLLVDMKMKEETEMMDETITPTPTASSTTTPTTQPIYFAEQSLTQKQAFDELNAYLEEWTYENQDDHQQQQENETQKHQQKESKYTKPEKNKKECKSKKCDFEKKKSGMETHGKKHKGIQYKQQEEMKKQQVDVKKQEEMKKQQVGVKKQEEQEEMKQVKVSQQKEEKQEEMKQVKVSQQKEEEQGQKMKQVIQGNQKEEEQENESISLQPNLFVARRNYASYKFFKIFQQFVNSNKLIPVTASRFQSFIYENIKPSQAEDMDELFFVLYQIQGIMKFTQKWFVEKQSCTFETENASVLPRYLENVVSKTFRAAQFVSTGNEIEADPVLCYTSLSSTESKTEKTADSISFTFNELLNKRVLYFESFSTLELFFKEVQKYSSSIIIKKENDNFWKEIVNNYYKEDNISNTQNGIPWLLYFCWYWKIEALVWKDMTRVYVSMIKNE